MSYISPHYVRGIMENTVEKSVKASQNKKRKIFFINKIAN